MIQNPSATIRGKFSLLYFNPVDFRQIDYVHELNHDLAGGISGGGESFPNRFVNAAGGLEDVEVRQDLDAQISKRQIAWRVALRRRQLDTSGGVWFRCILKNYDEE